MGGWGLVLGRHLRACRRKGGRESEEKGVVGSESSSKSRVAEGGVIRSHITHTDRGHSAPVRKRVGSVVAAAAAVDDRRGDAASEVGRLSWRAMRVRTPRPTLLTPGMLIRSRWRVRRRLGRGAFGDVFLALDELSGKPYALKAEVGLSPRLQREADAYELLLQSPGFPRVRWFGPELGVEDRPLQLLVLDLLGPSLEDARHMTGSVLPAPKLARFGREMLQRLEDVHSAGLIHGDIKPSNYLLPARRQHLNASVAPEPPAPRLFLVDFGFASCATNCERSSTEALRARIPRRGIVGSARFSSISNHLLQPLGPRDDIEALAYSLAYLGTGSLPWLQKRGVEEIRDCLKPACHSADLALSREDHSNEDSARVKKRRRFNEMLEAKVASRPEEIALGLPCGFSEFIRQARALSPGERPDYDGLKQLLVLHAPPPDHKNSY